MSKQSYVYFCLSNFISVGLVDITHLNGRRNSYQKPINPFNSAHLNKPCTVSKREFFATLASTQIHINTQKLLLMNYLVWRDLQKRASLVNLHNIERVTNGMRLFTIRRYEAFFSARTRLFVGFCTVRPAFRPHIAFSKTS